jgi:hypothetical protein
MIEKILYLSSLNPHFMNSKILISTIVVALAFVSCKKDLEPQESTPQSELVALGLAKDSSQVAVAAQNPTSSTLVSTAGAINPAHGAPGHRCDIAVGAPLNSAPSQTAQPAQTVQVNPAQQNVVTTTTTAAPAKVAKGMNPAHGQPGHRCDIPVGSPLNSAPVKTTTASSTVQSGTAEQNFTITPPAGNPAVPALLSTETAAPADGMNPAHGQPGHRCDVAVGAPLPKS